MHPHTAFFSFCHRLFYLGSCENFPNAQIPTHNKVGKPITKNKPIVGSMNLSPEYIKIPKKVIADLTCLAKPCPRQLTIKYCDGGADGRPVPS